MNRMLYNTIYLVLFFVLLAIVAILSTQAWWLNIIVMVLGFIAFMAALETKTAEENNEYARKVSNLQDHRDL